MLLNLSYLSTLSFTGPGALKLLQGQTSCNMHEVSDGTSKLGALCNAQGRVISNFLVYKRDDAIILQMPNEMVELTLLALQKYIPFYKVTIENRADILKYSFYDTSVKILQNIFPELPRTEYESITDENITLIKLPGECEHYELIVSLDCLS